MDIGGRTLLFCYTFFMKFKQPPSRERIYQFQKRFKALVSFLLFLLGSWHLRAGYHLFTADRTHYFMDALFSVFLSAILFGLSIFLYRNRSNNTPRYEGFEP